MSRKNNLAQIWAERIKACQASGINVKAWCGENNVSASQYYYWIRKLNNSSNELVGDEQAGHFMPRKDPRGQCHQAKLQIIYSLK